MSLMAEQSLVGSILIDAACLPAIRQNVAASDFAIIQNRAIFEAAVRLSDAGQPVDPVTIQADARKHGLEVSSDYLMQLMEFTPTAAHAVQYAQEVQDDAIRKQIADAAQNALDGAIKAEKSPSELLAGALEQLQRIDAGTSSALMTSEDSAVQFLAYREALESGSGHMVVKTGYNDLDKLLGGGMLREGLYILAARPGVGKTTLGLKIADFAAKTGPVLFVSLEMSPDQLTARRIADRSGLSIGQVLMGADMDDEDRGKMAQALSAISESGLVLNRKPGATVADISVLGHSIPGLRLIVVDYLGLILPENRRASIYERITDNSGALKRLARSLGIPILCLAQLNRASEQRQDKRPNMADLRDSGAIEQDADGVILLHRPALYWPPEKRPKPWEAEPLDVIVDKNRHGATGQITLDFYGRNGRVRG